MRKLVGKDQEIINKYLGGKSTYELATEYNVSHHKISCVLRENNILHRDRSGAQSLRFVNYKTISSATIDLVNGWLLGDGQIAIYGSKQQGRFAHVSKHKEYIDYIIDIFNKNGIICRKNKCFDKKYKTYHYRLTTESTLQFRDIYEKWYAGKNKSPPRDLILSSETIKHWIYDDGTISPTKGHLRLCTCAFSVEDCEFLSCQLKRYVGGHIKNIGVVEKKNHPRIYCSKIDISNLLKKIGWCGIDCFGYKWQNNVDAINK